MAWLIILFLALPPGALGQQSSAAPVFKQEELEQIVAPIALHPDALVAQILMASTYPLEVVQAEGFTKQNSNLKGDALTAALEKQLWDPSVKSLVNFPQLLTMMSEKLELDAEAGGCLFRGPKKSYGYDPEPARQSAGGRLATAVE